MGIGTVYKRLVNKRLLTVVVQNLDSTINFGLNAGPGFICRLKGTDDFGKAFDFEKHAKCSVIYFSGLFATNIIATEVAFSSQYAYCARTANSVLVIKDADAQHPGVWLAYTMTLADPTVGVQLPADNMVINVTLLHSIEA